MNKTGAKVLALIAAGMLAVAGRSLAGRPETQPPRSLDEQLLEELGADPVEEPDRKSLEPGVPQAKPGDPPGKGPPAPRDPDARLRRELGAAAVAEEENPLLEVARRMRTVEGRIARNDSGSTTQAEQQQIVAELERLIAQARKRCQASKPGNQPSKGASGGPPKQGAGGTQPSEKPTAPGPRQAQNGGAQKLDKQQRQTLMQQLWDVALPPQQRQQLLQSPFDEFLPKYELLIEQYFRRLSEAKDER